MTFLFVALFALVSLVVIFLTARDILAATGFRCCPIGIHGGEPQMDGCTLYKVCPSCKRTIIIDTGGGAL